MRGTEGSQRDAQLAVAEADVARSGEQLMQERASLLLSPGVVRAQQPKQIALGLVSEHLDDVRQVLALGGEFDHSTLAEVSDLNARGHAAALVDEPGQAITCSAQVFAEFAVGDLEATHRGAALLGVVSRGGAVLALELGELGARGADLLVQRAALGVGYRTGGIFRFDPIVHERVEEELLAHVLEEVLLSPAIEHAVSHLDVTQIPTIGDHLGLMMAVVAQARDLPQAQLPLEEAHRLIMQLIAHPASVELGAAMDEAPLVDETTLALAISEDIEAVLDHRVEQLRAPPTAVEDDGRAPLADHPAHLSKQLGEGLGQRSVDIPGDEQQRVAGAIIDPVVGGGGHGQMAPCHECPGNRTLTVIGADVAIDVQEPHQMPALIDAQARQFRPQLLSVLVCREASEPTPQGLDLGRPVEPQESTEGSRV